MSLKLYPFQQEFIDKYHKVPNILNGDDMGLGKTVQGIAMDLKKRELYVECGKVTKPVTLIVTRSSVMGVWARHYAAWAPHLTVEVMNRKNRGPFANSLLARKSDVYITHWGALRLLPELQKNEWFHVIADEVHAAKNRKAQQTQQLKKIRTLNKLGLSGTAADNRPDDVWSILNWLYPRKYTSFQRFYDNHVVYKVVVNEWTQRRYKEVLGVQNTEEFLADIKPFYIRRLKEDVLADLPDKYYTTVFCDLSMQQRVAYEQMKKHMMTWVGEHANEPVAAPVLIAQLIRLQQFAVAYGQVEIKRTRKLKGCEVEERGLHRSVNKVADGPELCAHCGEDIVQELEVLRLTDPSTKLDAIMDIIEDNPDQSIAVFGQSKQAIKMLATRLDAKGIDCLTLTGDTPIHERDDLVQKFQSKQYRVFAGTIKAGGEGITLTAASTVIFLDRDWSPSKNRQAEDRLHRIGQENAVQVIDIVARDTVDAGRIQKIKLKWSWIQQMLGDVNPAQAELEQLEMQNLLKELERAEKEARR